MQYQLWVDPQGLDTFCLADQSGDAARMLLPDGSVMEWTVDAVSHFDAMSKYYAYRGYGVYSTDYPELDGANMNDALMIDCQEHGKSVMATVCCHLLNNNGAPLGFIQNSAEPDDLQWWCYACEYLFLQEEDKTDKFKKFCNFAVVCSKCYQKIKAAHDIES